MANSFVFDDESMTALERVLSRDRLSTYAHLGGGSREKALRLYLHNLRVSSSIFESIGVLEVALRNSIHLTLTSAYSSEHWYERVPFKWLQREADALQSAKSQIRFRKKQVVPSRVISEMTFGFWCGIAGKPYLNRLWIPHLFRAFPHKALSQKDAYWRLEEIRRLRNRIAHHECILRLDLVKGQAALLDILGWICPTTRCWLEAHNGFAAIWQSRPQ